MTPLPGEESTPSTTDKSDPANIPANTVGPGQAARTGDTFTGNNGHSYTDLGGGRVHDNTTGQTLNANTGQPMDHGINGHSIPQMGQQLRQILPQLERLIGSLPIPGPLKSALMGIMGQFANNMSPSGAGGGGPSGGQAPSGGGPPARPGESEPDTESPDGEGEGTPGGDGSETPSTAPGGVNDPYFNRPPQTFGSADTAPTLPAPGVAPHTGAWGPSTPLETTAPNAPSAPAPATETQPSAPIPAPDYTPPLPAARPSPPTSQGGGGVAAPSPRMDPNWVDNANSAQANNAQANPAPDNPGDTPGVATVPSNAPPSPNVGASAQARSTPFRYGGTLSLGGQRFGFVSGGAGRGALPYGTYNLHPGGIGQWGRTHGAIAGISDRNARGDNSVADPRYPGHRRVGVEVHPSGMRGTEGCIGINRSQYPAFQRAFRQASANGQQLQLTVGPNGASIHPAGQGTAVASNTAINDDPARQTARNAENAGRGAQLFGNIESSGNPNAPVNRVGAGGEYQQKAEFQQRYGGNRTGRVNRNPVYQRRVLNNFASRALRRNPNMTIGDLYANYAHGSPEPWRRLPRSYQQNMLRRMAAMGINPNAPASQFFDTQMAMQ